MKVPRLHSLRLLSAILWAFAVAAPGALGHGSMERPVSRVYQIFLENPESPVSASSRAAVAVAGTQAFYDWHEVNRRIPDYNYQAVIPDGQLASAGRAKYAGLDLLRSDWPKTRVNRGPYHMIFNAHVPHDPSFFQAFISKPGWSPLQPLRWADLEPLPGAEFFRREGSKYTFDVDLPQRTGHHVIYVIWQRIDPAGEVFFSISDVDFGNGAGYGNPYDGILTPPVDHSSHTNLTAYFRVASDWGNGFNGEVTVTNTTPYLWNGWNLSFSLNGQIQNIWSSHLVSQVGSRYTVTNDTWNTAILPGQRVVFGFSAMPSYAQVGAPYAFVFNGSAALPGTGAGSGSGSTVTNPPAPPPAPKPTNSVTVGSATLTFVEDSRWSTGFNGTVRITNRGTNVLQGWTVGFHVNGTVSSQWNAVQKSGSGGTYTFGNAAWNGTVAPGATVSFGFQAAAGPGIVPSNFTFNGSQSAATGSPGSVPTPGPVPSRLDLKVTSNWGSGFTGAATINQLSGPALSGWTLTFDFPHQITSIWDAVLVSKVGNRYTIRNAAWNGALKPGSGVTFGFNATPGSTVTPPSNVTLK